MLHPPEQSGRRHARHPVVYQAVMVEMKNDVARAARRAAGARRSRSSRSSCCSAWCLGDSTSFFSSLLVQAVSPRSSRGAEANRLPTASTRSRRRRETRTRSARGSSGRSKVVAEEVVDILSGASSPRRKSWRSRTRQEGGHGRVVVLPGLRARGHGHETLHTINGIQGVIKFVGHERLPQWLRPEEVNRLLGIADEVEENGPEGRDSFPGQAVAIAKDLHRFQRHGRGSDGRQGQGSG